MTILVTGARGNIGSQVVTRLHAAGGSLRASSRRSGDLAVPPGVQTVTLDLREPGTYRAALDGVTRVFLYAEPDGVADFLKAADEAGVRKVVVLSSNTVLLPGADQDPLARHHRVVEEAVFASGLPHVLLRPGAFASNALGWSTDIREGRAVQQPFADAQMAPVHDADVADVAAAALAEGSGMPEAVPLSGPQSLSFRAEVGIIADLLGREIHVRDMDRAEAAETMGRFVPPPVLTSLLDQWEAALAQPADTSATCEPWTGAPARTFRQWVEEHLGAFGDAPAG
ncbi:NAD(P)H-binding protein [Streptomyces sp. SCSIO 30461]|uniref:NAD(P)H-binding protein n=1 Tax=Streptomyces sp. SCSIO 30461 TaxID=3118085 RepID=UPI0030CD7AE7